MKAEQDVRSMYQANLTHNDDVLKRSFYKLLLKPRILSPFRGKVIFFPLAFYSLLPPF